MTTTLVMLGGLAAPGAAPAPAGSVRILTYNIHHGQGMDGSFDLPRVAGVLLQEAPDLIALQEVDQGTDRAGGIRQAEVLGHLTGMHVTFGKAMDYDGGEYGVAILSRWPFREVLNRPLPHADGYETRTALTVAVQPAAGEVVRFTTTHLDQGRDATNRILQAAALNRLLAGDDGPGILAGDFNSRVDTEVMEKMRSLWADMFVEPPPPGAERPRYRVDYVMARPGARWRAIEARAVEATGVSDHRPIFAALELTD